MRLFGRNALARLLRTFALLPALAACGDIVGVGDSDERELRRATQRWNDHRIYNYDYTVQQSCFCPAELGRAVIVMVRGGFVYDLRYESTFAPVPPFAWSAFPTVEGLFDIVDDAIYRADDVDTTFDREYGFPRLIDIDYERNAIDDELTISTSRFVIR